MGMSHRRFMGWVPSHARDSEWDDEQRALAIASFEVDRETPDHGFHLSEALSAEADPANRDGAFKFRAGLPVVDWAEKARRDAADAYRRDNDNANMNGLFFPVEKVDRTS